MKNDDSIPLKPFKEAWLKNKNETHMPSVKYVEKSQVVAALKAAGDEALSNEILKFNSGKVNHIDLETFSKVKDEMIQAVLNLNTGIHQNDHKKVYLSLKQLFGLNPSDKFLDSNFILELNAIVGSGVSEPQKWFVNNITKLFLLFQNPGKNAKQIMQRAQEIFDPKHHKVKVGQELLDLVNYMFGINLKIDEINEEDKNKVENLFDLNKRTRDISHDFYDCVHHFASKKDHPMQISNHFLIDVYNLTGVNGGQDIPSEKTIKFAEVINFPKYF